MFNLSYQVVVNTEKYLPQKEKVSENNECHEALVIFADLFLSRQIFPFGTRYFRGPFPFEANISF